MVQKIGRFEQLGFHCIKNWFLVINFHLLYFLDYALNPNAVVFI